jgi:hypothetical protein
MFPASSVEVAPPGGRPCATCPWRRSTAEGAIHPAMGGCTINTAGLREHMWQAVSRSYSPMLCHRADLTSARECAGFTVLCQREVLRHHKTGRSALRAAPLIGALKRMAASFPLPLGSVFATVGLRPDQGMPERFFDVPRAALLRAAHPLIGDPEIAHEKLAPPVPGEFE